MTEKQIEAFNAVDKINQELYNKVKSRNFDGFDQPLVNITFCRHMIFISLSIPSEMSLNLPEIHLYNSHHCDRIYYEKSDKYETFYKLIKRKFLLVKSELNNIKI